MAEMGAEIGGAARRRRWRAMCLSLAIVLGGAVLLPGLGYLYVAVADAQAQPDGSANPRSEYWRAVREGQVGYSAIGQQGVLIQNGGQNYRQVREAIIFYGGWAIFVVLIALVAFYLARGRIPLEGGRAGKTVPRWSAFERTVHWFTASTFIVLAITGLSLLFGRVFMIPVFGLKGFSVWAEFAKDVHNAIGPLFSLGVAWIIISWFEHNLPRKIDWEWFKQGGGIVGRKHPPAGRMNGGEKVWFWIICTVGVATVVTGFILDFPIYGQGIETMQASQLIHGALAVVWICVFFGHAYIGTLGTEGALEGMTRGEVDVNWAKQHHDVWYEELEAKGVVPREPAAEKPAGAREQPT